MASDWLRQIVQTRLGVVGRALLAWRARRRAEALLANRGLARAASVLATQFGDRVQGGPFAGLVYPRRLGDIVHTAKLLGVYEVELHAPLERLLARSPLRVVNIGSGDGYYAVGIARRLPVADIIAVDPDPFAQRGCAATARRNGVHKRVVHRAMMDTAALNAVIVAPRKHRHRPVAAAPHTLCVVDCEGCEEVLLDPLRVPALIHTDILVETHDFACAGVTAALATRFAASHDVERVAVVARSTASLPALADLPPAIASGLLDEFRHQPQAWLILTARAPRS